MAGLLRRDPSVVRERLWPTHRTSDDPLRAFVDATAKTRKRLISIRVDEELLDLTKELARQHGMPYQAVIRVWIEEGLRRAIREGAREREHAQAPPRQPPGTSGSE